MKTVHQLTLLKSKIIFFFSIERYSTCLVVGERPWRYDSETGFNSANANGVPLLFKKDITELHLSSIDHFVLEIEKESAISICL